MTKRNCKNPDCINGHIYSKPTGAEGRHGPKYTYCECEADRRFRRRTPHWIYSAAVTVNPVRAKFGKYPLFLQINASDTDAAELLRAAFLDLTVHHFDRIPAVVDERDMVQDVFNDRADWTARRHYKDAWLVIRTGTFRKPHKMLPEVLADVIETRVRRGLRTWVLRETPYQRGSYEHSPELTRLYGGFEVIGAGSTTASEAARKGGSIPQDTRAAMADMSRYMRR